MARILFFLFVIFLVWLAVRVVGGSRRGAGEARSDAGPAGEAPVQKGIETIMQCAWCGVHIPRGEAVALPDGRIYCSDAHRDAARQAAAPVDRSRT